jgi:hydroxymethylpyrimidine pyrophosphatase-like HAD family hydrolase
MENITWNCMRSAEAGPSRVAKVDALAVDLDGTLTADGRPLRSDLIDRLQELKGKGMKLILVTGRCIKEARRITGEGLFDATVAENGAVLIADGVRKNSSPPGWDRLRAELLHHLGGGCEEIIISAEKGKLGLARRLVSGQARVELNKDRLMVVPLGVDKGKGLLTVLSMLHLTPEKTACMGDGENDSPMFDAAGVKIALANSVEELKSKADFVTKEGDGDGAMEAIGKLLEIGEPRSQKRRIGAR